MEGVWSRYGWVEFVIANVTNSPGEEIVISAANSWSVVEVNEQGEAGPRVETPTQFQVDFDVPFDANRDGLQDYIIGQREFQLFHGIAKW